MASYNRVILLGNLTRDPQIRNTPGGTTVASFGMAINRKWKDSGGNPKEEVCFVECAAFEKTAETIRTYCHKGDPLHVEGRLKFDQWENDEGQKRSKLTVVVERIQLMGGKKDDAAPTQTPPQTNGNGADNPDDEIPF